jgi:hypothetical protein
LTILTTFAPTFVHLSNTPRTLANLWEPVAHFRHPLLPGLRVLFQQENQGLWNLYMTQKIRPTNDEENSALDSRQSAKKPYSKPAFRSEKVFETMVGVYQGSYESAMPWTTTRFMISFVAHAAD